MTWLKIDDKLTSHRKWVGLTLQAKSLWFHTAVWCGAHNADGLVPEHVLPLLTFQSSLAATEMNEAINCLVKAEMWKRIPKSRGGGIEILNWLEYQPSKQQVQDRAAADDIKAVRKRLHDWLHKTVVGKKVKQAIDARDGMWCRYCGTETVITPGDRRGPHRRTYDLRDPSSTWDMTARALPADEVARIAEMWRVACGWCNAIKGSRTPEEADLEERPAPRRLSVLPRTAANGSRTVREVGTGLAGSDQDGSDQVGKPPQPSPSSGVGPFDDVPLMEGVQ